MEKQERKLSHNQLKEILGEKCCNCGSNEDIEYHHIIPVSLGGKDIISNMCCLCRKCHSLLHFGRTLQGNHSELIKNGIKEYRKNGKHWGKPAANYEELMKSIAENSTLFKGGTLPESEIMKLNNVKSTCYYKYRKQLLEDLKLEPWRHSFPKPIQIRQNPLYKKTIEAIKE